MVILLFLLSSVTAGGFAFDTGTRSAAAIEFLTVEMERAVSISCNVATVLNRPEIDLQWDPLDPIIHITGDTDPLPSILAVFGGGEIDDSIGQTRHIACIKSYNTVLPNYDSTNYVSVNAADVEGNVVLVPAFLYV